MVHWLQYFILSPGNTPEWKYAVGLFVANAANLMKAIKDTLRASKLAITLPNNYSPETSFLSFPQSPHSAGATATTLLPSQYSQSAGTLGVISAAQGPFMTGKTLSNPPRSSTYRMEYYPYSPHIPLSPPSYTNITCATQSGPSLTLALDYCSSSTYTVQSPSATTCVALSQLPPEPLTKEHTAKICKCLFPLRAKWKTIGTFLCVEHNTLAAIKTDCEDSAEMLTELIAEWLKQLNPPPTGQSLAEAVQCISPEKADEIRQIFCA